MVTLVTYGVLFLGVRHYLLKPGAPAAAPKVEPAAQKVFVFEFSQLKEASRGPATSEEASNESGGPAAPDEVVSSAATPVAMEARKDAFDLASVGDLTPGDAVPVPHGPNGGGGQGAAGVPGGSGGAQGTGSGSASGGGGSAQAGQAISGLDLEVEEHIKPDYPFAAIKARIEGYVTVRMEVDDRGRPSKVWVVSGNPIFHASVIDAFKRYRFRNLKRRGIPTPAIIEIPVWFHFDR